MRRHSEPNSLIEPTEAELDELLATVDDDVSQKKSADTSACCRTLSAADTAHSAAPQLMAKLTKAAVRVLNPQSVLPIRSNSGTTRERKIKATSIAASDLVSVARRPTSKPRALCGHRKGTELAKTYVAQLEVFRTGAKRSGSERVAGLTCHCGSMAR